MNFSFDKIKLDLKVNWKLSRNETLYKENFIFKIIEDGQTYCGEIAPNIRYGETPEKLEAEFIKFQEEYKKLSNHFILFSKENQYSHSFQFGVNSAFTHRSAALQHKSVSSFLGLNQTKKIATSYSVPIMEENLLDEYLKALSRFKYIKIKVNQENAISFVKAIASRIKVPLRIDGNEAWKDFDSYKKFENEVKGLNIEFIEQPFAAKMVDEYISLKKDSMFEIMADESIEQVVDFDLLEKQFHSVNVKLMKAGGYYQAIELLKEAKQRGMKTMLGCMIETSLGISSAMNLASLADYFDLDGSLLIKNDPYHFINEKNGYLTLV